MKARDDDGGDDADRPLPVCYSFGSAERKICRHLFVTKH